MKRELLHSLALDLTKSLSSEDRAERLVRLVADALRCDAAALLIVNGEFLVPVASTGFLENVYGRCFAIADHPRFEVISRERLPIRFPAESELPDPFEGLLEGDDHTGERHIHSCLGCALRIEDELIGILTADSSLPGVFDELEEGVLEQLAALAAAALRTSQLIDALERRTQRQGEVVRSLLQAPRTGTPMLGRSTAMERLREDVELIAATPFPVLILGETGVGKELVVQRLHELSARSAEPLVYVNCASLPESIVESELFGHARGAFTGALSDRLGKFSVADGASLFLDEIGELPLSVQPKLLRVLQHGELQRVGVDQPQRVDVRIFAATNRKLEEEVREGRFRSDLLHRLDVCRITVPPLRARRDDIAILAGAFADRARSQLGLGPVILTQEVIGALRERPWYGNVRELENAIGRAVLYASRRARAGGRIFVDLEDIELESRDARSAVPEEHVTTYARTGSPLTLKSALDETRRTLIRAAVTRHKGNWAAAARELGVARANLHRLAQRLGLKPAPQPRA